MSGGDGSSGGSLEVSGGDGVESAGGAALVSGSAGTAADLTGSLMPAAALPPQSEVTPAPEANEKGRNNPGSGAVAAPPRTRQDRKAKLGPFLHRLKVALTTPEYQRFKLLLRAFKQAQGNTASTGKLEGLVNDVARILDHARGRTPQAASGSGDAP